ncbi:MAG TPA: hypothetical protein VKD72_00290 [Gemmataceae bacterium]|nr:hypothetical protein [Gemmataceae bacterium]
MFKSLFSKKSARPATRQRSFVPSFETLEARDVPTATASFSVVGGQTVLSIRGDNSAETIHVFNDGQGHINATGVVGLNPPGQSPTAQAVDKIEIDMQGGDDVVRFTQGTAANPVTMTRSLELTFDGGFDDDYFEANVHGQIGFVTQSPFLGQIPFGHPVLVPVSLQITANGGTDGILGLAPGHDTMNINAGSLTGNDNLDILAGSKLALDLDGQGGDDQISVTYGGELDGKLVLRANGNDGDDIVSARLNLDAGSTGHVSGPDNAAGFETPALVFGGYGNDILTFTVHKDDPTDPATVNAQINGGGDPFFPGFDQGTFSAQFVDNEGLEIQNRV